MDTRCRDKASDSSLFLTGCHASLGIVTRGELNDINRTLREIGPILERNGIRVVYKLVYPGKLWIKREPITEIEMEMERGEVEQA